MVDIEWPPPRALMVAELGASAAMGLDHAKYMIDAAAASGADAVKTQCFRAEDMALPGVHTCGPGLWRGRDLFDLYAECAMPLEWHEPLKRCANDLGLAYFASSFQPWHVDFLEDLGVPAHKVASFEVDHAPLLTRIAETGKPCMYSTGNGGSNALEPILWGEDGLSATPAADCWIRMHCVSAYPADPSTYPLDEFHDALGWPGVGLSDHTLGHTIAVAAAAAGGEALRVIEKHFTLSRADGGPDAAFSAEPDEFAAMVEAVRVVEAALAPSGDPKPHPLRRGLWVVADAKAGETVSESTVGILRPAAELTPVDWAEVKGKRFARDVRRGEALTWEVVE